MGFGARHRTSSLTGKSNYYYESMLSEEEEEGLLCDDPDDVSPPSLTEGDCQAENNLDWDEEELEEAKLYSGEEGHGEHPSYQSTGSLVPLKRKRTRRKVHFNVSASRSSQMQIILTTVHGRHQDRLHHRPKNPGPARCPRRPQRSQRPCERKAVLLPTTID